MSDVASFTNEEKQLMMEFVTQQRKMAEKYGVDSADYKRYVEQADEAMKKLDDKHEAIIKQLAEKEAIEKELKERVNHLETLGQAQKTKESDDVHLISNGIFKKNWKALTQSNEYEANEYMKEMVGLIEEQGNDFPAELSSFKNAVLEYKAANDLLRTDIGEFGGFTVPIAWSNKLREQLIEVSPVRRFATVETISGKSIMMPVRQGIPTADWEGEAEESTTSISNYVTSQLTPHRLAVTIPITWDMINNNAYNVSARIMNDGRKAFARAEGLAFVSGDGVKKPLGFTQDPDVPFFSTATSTLTFDDMINITGEIKQGYRPNYFFSRKTLVYLRTLKDAVNGRYLWNGPFGDAAAGSPATINGIPYSAEFIDMDDPDTNDGYPVLFADMREFYCITDRQDMVIIRDELTRKKQAVVEFELMKWTHGQPVMKEAGILMKKIS